MSKPAAVLGILACAACSGPVASSSPSDGGSLPGPDSGTDRGPETATDAKMDGGPPCVPNDGSYTCLGGTWLVCPSTAYAAPSSGCDYSVPSCMGCDGIVGMNVPPRVGTGRSCSCRDAGSPIPDGSAGYWDCVGTGYTCE